ncbi:NLI interacting factor-like phosphatase [Carpediemonas membranifera]|uniref:Mitochondrial import inner membrane translocase subunit TIM50 n=1 Tax=Carpediemonas membranifera TaxID=201153 RepID=A0A8J6BHJ7_9EUKA|nr:NLI interacting factor-like phosphatase [Carpediemonas membranifera]|eukprot:KAG9397617.1 NLI interacting factor-like phosphatase [Carpediemonas membranifera]
MPKTLQQQQLQTLKRRDKTILVRRKKGSPAPMRTDASLKKNAASSSQKTLNAFISIKKVPTDPILSMDAFKNSVSALEAFNLDDIESANAVGTVLAPLPEQTLLLPVSRTAKPTLVLDLDLTLISSDFSNTHAPNKWGLSPKLCYHRGAPFGLFLRPGVVNFIQWASTLFELVIFTAGEGRYAETVLGHIDPDNLIRHRLSRSDCRPFRRRDLVKDLDQLGRPLERVVAVDDRLVSFGRHLSNLIPVPPFTGEPDDVLVSLKPMLKSLVDSEDIPGRLAKVLKTEERVVNRLRAAN